MKKLTIIIGLALLAHFCFSKPPHPPKGYRWVINAQFSDEFEGNSLDNSKWNDTFGTWEGRPPALFIPEAISVKNGNLAIKSGILEKAYKDYTIYGGAVSSNTYNAHFGYYECRVKASKIAMSTTFWMSNPKVSFRNTDCETDSYSQELDIQEAVGGGTTYEKFRNGMNSNTHFRYIKCGAEKEEFISRGTGTKLHSEVWEEYHTYGAWWKNANEVTFYANDKVFDTVQVRTDISEKPFDRPMKINMVTETYNWQPPPSHKDLLNDSINTAYYDWVRSYILVPVDKVFDQDIRYPQIFSEEITITGDVNIDSNTIVVPMTYISNTDRDIEIKLFSGNRLLQSASSKLLAGYGNTSKTIPISFQLETGREYKIVVTLSDATSTTTKFEL